MQTITLEELSTEAALLTRIDRKYLLTSDDAAKLVDELAPSSRLLAIDGDTQFAYASVYFDTAELTCFHASARPRRRRFKVRTRQYVASGDAYTEVKTRLGKRTVKVRAPHLGMRVALDYRDLRFVGHELERAGIVAPDVLYPTLETTYRRATFLLADGVRMTVDADLSWNDLATGRRVASPDLVVLETKGIARASHADHLLRRIGKRETRFSKYATGLAVLRPTLPSNRWHRTIERWF